MERHDRTPDWTVAAVTIAAHLRLLHAERLEAEAAGGCAAYMTDLEDEIATCHHELVRAAVTEIAVLRADMAAPLHG